LNLDGTVGVKATLIQTDGATSLEQVGSNYYLFAVGTTNGPELRFGGAPVVANTGAVAGWTPVGAVATQTGYDVAFENAAGKFAVWAVDATGNYTSAVLTPTSGMSAALEALEPTFGQDLNLDGTVGVKTTLIQTDGSTSLTQVANNYFLF